MIALFIVASLRGDVPDSGTTKETMTEADRIATIHSTVLSGTFQIGLLAAEPDSEYSTSVTVLRRATMLAGWLENEGEFSKAISIARDSLKSVGDVVETNDSNRVERSYWEATILAKFVHDLPRAIQLLESARKIAPDDERLIELELRYSEALQPANS